MTSSNEQSWIQLQNIHKYWQIDQTIQVNEFKENNSHKLQYEFVKYKGQSNTYYAIYLVKYQNTNNQSKIL